MLAWEGCGLGSEITFNFSENALPANKSARALRVLDLGLATNEVPSSQILSAVTAVVLNTEVSSSDAGNRAAGFTVPSEFRKCELLRIKRVKRSDESTLAGRL